MVHEWSYHMKIMEQILGSFHNFIWNGHISKIHFNILQYRKQNIFGLQKYIDIHYDDTHRLYIYTPAIIWASTQDFGTYRLCANAYNKCLCSHKQEGTVVSSSISPYFTKCVTPWKTIVIIFIYIHTLIVWAVKTQASLHMSGESAHMCRLAWVFTACWCNKYQKSHALAHIFCLYLMFCH